MDPDPTVSPVPSAAEPRGRQLSLLCLAALGVVFGDIGTSPLYAFRECFTGAHRMDSARLNVLGVLSLIFWALVLIISIKYLLFILRADNRGEGGILSLTALLMPLRAAARRRPWFIMVLGLFGAALLYADGIITPAISVLSAVEGLSVAAPGVFDPYVELFTIAILVVLFLLQPRGTARVGVVFGPVLVLWFLTLAGLGIDNLVRAPEALQAVSPHYAVEFFWHNGWQAFLTLASVFLCVTGAEALYADIGHFGRRPIRVTWYWFVLPALLLNYFGQGAYLLHEPGEAAHPLYGMAPGWARIPLVGLATAAAVIASQAIITGAFSLTLQAVQLGYAPRLTIRHTSPHQIGQIYIPLVNWALLLGCMALVLEFHSSTNLAAAYGVAITMTMVITTLLFYVLVRERWNWSLPVALASCGGFLLIDLAFCAANLTKIGSGGWLPLVVAGVIFLLMSTWRRGRQIVARRMRENLIPLELFLAEQLSNPPLRVPGVAIFLSSNPVGTPPALRHNVLHNRVLHELVVIVCVQTAEIPHVAPADRIAIEEIGEGFWRLVLNYGFMEQPDVPEALASVRHPGLQALEGPVSYFLGRETLLSTSAPGMARWRQGLFAWMSRNAQTAMAFFRLPPDRVVELGVQVEL